MRMMVDELVKAQQSSDVKFLELEEKRRKALKHEERLQKEERDFQLKLWSVVIFQKAQSHTSTVWPVFLTHS